MATSDRMHAGDAARRWAATWQRAWETLDLEAAVALYANDAVFSSQPFREVHHGRDGVREYVSGAFAEESNVRAWFGEPVVDGDRTAVQLWAALRESGDEVTLVGTSVLRFDANELVAEQRDTWTMAAGRRQPPQGWGR